MAETRRHGSEALPPFAIRLAAWWQRAGRHDLPWQAPPGDSYRIWISEIMLQQTQVATVIPYYEKWLSRFPNLASLASAPLDEVLALWSGLGYYARARNLHRAALLCLSRHGGRLPDDPALLQTLPGIGRSTANAIISLAHDRVLPILDGNARRVLARHAAIGGWPGQKRVADRLWRAASQRLPASGGAVHTQAMMDLGSLLCTACRPACGTCPVGADCRARQTASVDELPASRPARPRPRKRCWLLVRRDPDGRILLERRPPHGIWGGLWSLPETEQDPGGTPLAPIDHAFTHFTLRLEPRLIGDATALPLADREQRWWAPDQALALGLPKPIRHLVTVLERVESG